MELSVIFRTFAAAVSMEQLSTIRNNEVKEENDESKTYLLSYRMHAHVMLPDTLHSVEQRATYLSEHYWDNYQFADTTLLKNEEITEQGFVNFIDILARFNDEIAQKGISAFTAKAYAQKPAKEKF